MSSITDPNEQSVIDGRLICHGPNLEKPGIRLQIIYRATAHTPGGQEVMSHPQRQRFVAVSQTHLPVVVPSGFSSAGQWDSGGK
jgi:hypothetical protein